ncbi:MAG: hypothetical protein M1832_005555 [Thelocarpon impressellum]|nr:MAG: hypothetical protein M1832_005555 [Thelocarpon impressellum]
MVLLTMTPAMVAAVTEYQSTGDAPRDTLPEEPLLDHPGEGKPISHGQIVDIWQSLRKQGSACHLDSLLRGSMVYSPPPKPKSEPTPEYRALMARLRREEEARAYERMLNPLPASETFSQRFPASPHSHAGTATETPDDDEVTYSDVGRQVALIINVLLSIIACSVAIWVAAGQWSTPRRLGLSMGGSGIVGVAEVVVYAGYLRRVKEAKSRHSKQVETKEVVKTWLVGGSGLAEKEPRPAKGQDGGVRKRNGRNILRGNSVGLAATAIVASSVSLSSTASPSAASSCAHGGYDGPRSPDALMRDYRAISWARLAAQLAMLAVSGWGLRRIGRARLKRE